MNINKECANVINSYWRERGLDPQARVANTTVTTVADEMVAQYKDGEPVRKPNGSIVKVLIKDVERTSTIPVVVSNMVDGHPTEKWPAER